MDQSQVRWALLKISAIALFTSSWIFVGFVFETRPESAVVKIRPASPIPPAEATLAALVRLPASLPSQLPAQLSVFQPHARTLHPIHMDVVKLGCWDMNDSAPQATSARWVRLIGRPCQSDTAIESIEIVNRINGYVSTVFDMQSEAMTTDFIPLQEGDNDIVVRIGPKTGDIVESRFVFVKQNGL